MKKNKSLALLDNKPVAGFTLIELLVAVSLFAIVVVTVLTAFSQITEIQFEVSDMQNLQDNARYIFDSLSREARTAVFDNNGSCVSAEHVFETNENSDSLRFLDYYGNCVEYSLTESKKIIRTVNDDIENALDIMSEDIEAEEFKVFIRDNVLLGEHPFVTFHAVLQNPNYINLSGDVDESKKVRFQASISTRANP